MLRKARTGDRELDSFQDAVDGSLRSLRASPLAGCVLLREVSLVSGSDNAVPHRLGSVPTGWFLVSPQGDTRVWEGSQPTSLHLHLSSSASATVSIVVLGRG